MARPLLRLLVAVAGVLVGFGVFVYGVIEKPSLTGVRLVLLIALGWGGGAYASAAAGGRTRRVRVGWALAAAAAGIAVFIGIAALHAFALRFAGLVVFLAVALLGQQDLRKGFIVAIRSDYAAFKARRSIRSNGHPSPMSSEPAYGVQPTSQMPGWVFWVALGWLVSLLALFMAWVTVPDFRHAFPHSYGHIPVEVPWFGAVGGSLVSFGGIFRYNREWDPAYEYWHPVRPLIGTFTGGIACVLLLALLRAAAGHTVGNDPTVYDAAAFVFGFAEAAFRQLIKALTDVFIKPGGVTAGRQAPPPSAPPAPPATPSGPSGSG